MLTLQGERFCSALGLLFTVSVSEKAGQLLWPPLRGGLTIRAMLDGPEHRQ